MLTNLCADNIKPVSEGDKNLTAVEENASVYHVYPVSRTTGEEMAECSEGGGRWRGNSNRFRSHMCVPGWNLLYAWC